ncbi:hypothetical protein Dimus_026684 [Dionaea muscipula]
MSSLGQSLAAAPCIMQHACAGSYSTYMQHRASTKQQQCSEQSHATRELCGQPHKAQPTSPADCAKGGHGAYTTSLDLTGYESGVIRASKFRAYHTPLNEQGDYVNAMRAAREFSSRVSDSLKLTAVHLVDAHLCSDSGKYASALLLSLSTMLHLKLPHVNVLSKIDLIKNYGKLDFNLDFYTDVQDLSYLQYSLDQDPRAAKYRKLTEELCKVIENFGLVDFTTLDIQAC